MKCQVCGKEADLPFKCSYCQSYFCIDHKLPENHQCPALPKEPIFWYQKRKRTVESTEGGRRIGTCPKCGQGSNEMINYNAETMTFECKNCGHRYVQSKRSPYDIIESKDIQEKPKTPIFKTEETISYKPKHGWKQRPKLKIDALSVVAGVLALVSLILPWWYFQISTSILGVSMSTSITADLYKATFSATIWGEGGQIPYVAEFPMDMWFGLIASSFILIAGILAIVGGVISGKIGKAVLVLAGILILSSIIVYAYGLQNELPRITEDLHDYPYNLTGFPQVQLFSSGAYSHPTYPVPAWIYSSYLYLGFWIDLIAMILVFISANRH